MEFVTIDFEKLNNEQTSVCEVGMVKYIDQKEVDTFYTTIYPSTGKRVQKGFCEGILKRITFEKLEKSPKFPKVYEEMKDFIGDAIIVCHSKGADLNYIYNCEKKFGLTGLYHNGYIDTEEVGKSIKKVGSLPDLYKALFHKQLEEHHEALHDALACGKILLSLSSQCDIKKYIHKEKYLPYDVRKAKELKGRMTNTVSSDGLLITDIHNITSKEFFASKRYARSGMSEEEKDELDKKLTPLNAQMLKSFSRNTKLDILIIADKLGPSKKETAIKMQKEGKSLTVLLFDEVMKFLQDQ